MKTKVFPLSKTNIIEISVKELEKIVNPVEYSFFIDNQQVTIKQLDKEEQVMAAFEEAKNAPDSDFIDL